MYSLPTSIAVKDKAFKITNDGDYRMILDCFNALRDEEMSEDFRVLACLLIFYNDFKCYTDIVKCQDYMQGLIEEMYKFFNCGSTEAPGAKMNYSVLDWDKDEQIICSAINNVAQTEVRGLPYLHWWTFMGYFTSIGESVLSTVVSIRSKIVKHKKLEKWEQDFKNENPNYFNWKSTTVQDREVENEIRRLWNSGGE